MISLVTAFAAENENKKRVIGSCQYRLNFPISINWQRIIETFESLGANGLFIYLIIRQSRSR